MKIDRDFPHLSFSSTMSATERGNLHGEEYSEAIKELCLIRRGLMLTKSPHLEDHLEKLSQEQYDITKRHFPLQWEELEAIRRSSGISIEDIVILNNYTDFRDIQLEDEGCTTVGLNREEKVSGQTWDMHSSAKNYVCTMEVPGKWNAFSMLGCIGMMGANSQSLFVGVNNLNTQKARSGVIWPALIRALLECHNIKSFRETLLSAPVTSGHNYLISDGNIWENWEVGATFQSLSCEINEHRSAIFHTNHCLDNEAIALEEPLSTNSTSQNRFKIIKEKEASLANAKDMITVFQNHDEYPKSLCSHFQADTTDPSTTCGGAVFDHTKKTFSMWRCCPKDPKRYILRELQL